jgi:hypothetical protein
MNNPVYLLKKPIPLNPPLEMEGLVKAWFQSVLPQYSAFG